MVKLPQQRNGFENIRPGDHQVPGARVPFLELERNTVLQELVMILPVEHRLGEVTPTLAEAVDRYGPVVLARRRKRKVDPALAAGPAGMWLWMPLADHPAQVAAQRRLDQLDRRLGQPPATRDVGISVLAHKQPAINIFKVNSILKLHKTPGNVVLRDDPSLTLSNYYISEIVNTVATVATPAVATPGPRPRTDAAKVQDNGQDALNFGRDIRTGFAAKKG